MIANKNIISRLLILIVVSVLILSGGLFSEKEKKTGKVLTLNQIIKKVLKQNKNLMAEKWGKLAKDGDIVQASLRLNPEVGVEIGNFAGSGDNKGFKSSESSIQIAQTILLRGKREKQIDLARSDKVISIRNYEMNMSNLIKETKQRFVKLLHIQEKYNIRKEMVDLASQILKKISIRVKAGRTSPVELSRAKVSLLRNQLSLKRLDKERIIMQQNLTSLWSKTRPDFKKVKGNLNIRTSIPEIDLFKNYLSRNIMLKLLSSEIDHNRAQLVLQKAFKSPDPTVSAGFKRMNESNSTAFTFSFSIPIPLYNRNQGMIIAAEYLLKKSEYKYKAEKTRIENDLIAIYEKMKNAFNTSQTIKNKILPEAQKTYLAINRGYDLGKFGYLDVYDTYKTLLEVKEEYLGSISEYWLIKAEIEQISGLEIYKINKNKEKNNEN